MDESKSQELRALIGPSRAELESALGNYRALLDELEGLERALAEDAAGADDTLESVSRALAAHPRLMQPRAVTRIDEGLDETRKLVELINQIIVLGEERAREAQRARRE